jgi:hypothetical protein
MNERIEIEHIEDYTQHLQWLSEADLITEYDNITKWTWLSSFVRKREINTPPVQVGESQIKIQIYKNRTSAILSVIFDKQLQHKLIKQ